MIIPRGIQEENKPSILVVDDHPMNLEVMEGLLYHEGYSVLTALNAVDALDLLSRNQLDMAILDVMMPGMNGFELCQKIKMQSGNTFFPVILVTALDELKDKITGLEAGADDFLTKPFHTIELTTKIRSLLRLRKLQGELDHSEDIILTLAIAIEAKDLYTKGHSERVGTLSMEFASFLGLPEDDRHLLFKSGVLHDIGKIGVDNQLLHKTGKLLGSELKTIKEHVLIGETICFPLNSARRILPVIRHHHERWDGKGFPDGLKGEEIPFFARIIAITDSFDAMVSMRPYRAPYAVAEAVSIMNKERNDGQWDPWLLDRFIEMMKDHREFIL